MVVVVEVVAHYYYSVVLVVVFILVASVEVGMVLGIASVSVVVGFSD